MPSATTPSPLSTDPPLLPVPRPLPPPSTFDILPPLHTLLTRLLLPPPPSSSSTQPPTSTPESPTHQPLSSTHLSPKNLGSAASAVKIKIQKARVAVQSLPDMDRTTQEQEVEIGELEREVERLRGVLGGLGTRGVEGAGVLEIRGKEEIGMGMVEEMGMGMG